MCFFGIIFCKSYVIAQDEPTGDTEQYAQTKPLIPLEYRFPKLPDNPYSFSPPGGGLYLKPPSNVKTEIVYDPVTNQYVFKEKVGTMDVGSPYSMDFSEYNQFNLENQKKQNWESNTKVARTGGVSGSTGFMPSFSLGGETFDRIFGTNEIAIVPQGSAELIFGLNRTRTENPNLSESARKNTTFNFDTKLQVNVQGTIGDKMRLGISYNTESMFEFENEAKLVYEGKEDEIIQKIEAGNISMPLPGSLITGSQSLFGLKTELKFGNLTVTAVASQQKGQTQSMEIKGGSQINEFDLRGDEYDANKHFFLSQYFRDNYEEAHRTVPTITSPVTITKIEVWITNKTNTTAGNRNIVAFMDLGEMNEHIYNRKNYFANNPLPVPDNDSTGNYNSLYRKVQTIVRDFSNNINGQLSGLDLAPGIDFEKLDRARLLTEREFTYHPTLGYISLNTALNADEVLGVAYEFTYRGKTYRVGELSRSGIAGEKGLVVKMLKGTKLVPRYPTWKLMMKNIYSIVAFGLEKKDFSMNVLYADDRTGNEINYIPEDKVSKDILLTVMGLDKVNSQSDAFPDGVFDFIEGVTINSSNGKIIFPVLEPFGKTLREHLAKSGLPDETIEHYVYQALYDSTLTKARELAEQNKFVLRGRYSSQGGSEIMLNAMNIPQGSVIVTVGGVKLMEGVDYTVDYNMGRVRIINEGLLESGASIKVSMESNAMFAIQQKTMVGTHLNYRFAENFNVGATVLRLTERPMTQKVNIGDEPLANTMLGFNTNYNTELPLLTTLVDKLPLIQTKAPSQLDFSGEFAQLLPGVSKSIMNRGSAYIDDFEAAKTSHDLRSFAAWQLSSIPQNDRASNRLFPESTLNDDLRIGMNRARLAWYTIDQLFTNKQYMNSQVTPDYIRNDPEYYASNFVRTIYEEELFPNRKHVTGMPTNISVLNVAFYPRERGPYNYDAVGTDVSAGVESNGELKNPRSRWGGMMRKLEASDFERNNYQYIEFWMMDPFVENMENGGGADLTINLGDISEDVLKDSRKSAEQGLPADGNTNQVDSTAWGYVPKIQPIVHSFDNVNRANQDVGLDGLNSARERRYFAPFLRDLENIVDGNALQIAYDDPSSDNFSYFLGQHWDAERADILKRYKYYNGTEGNSSASNQSNTQFPDEEDINRDNTMSETESYFQYKVSIRKADLRVGYNYIVDKVEGIGNTTDNGNIKKADWYQFRIPISEYEQSVGGIQDFKTIRFMRMFLTNCPDSIILRFARLELIRGEWRQYNQSFEAAIPGVTYPQSSEATFEIASVNIEENAGKIPVPYMVPPGFDRAVDQTTREMQQLNEQSMLLRVKDITNGDARAVYKTVQYDMRRYKTIEMEIHAEEIAGYPLRDNEMSVFIRIGSDYRNNFYEYEIPVKLTPWGMANYQDFDVWPQENKMIIDLEFLPHLKQLRNDDMRLTGSSTTLSQPFLYDDGDGRKYSVCGNPNLENIRVVMIGIRYPQNEFLLGVKSGVEVWVNELRLSNVSKKGGWAANGRLAVRLADFASVAISGESIQSGFGGVDSKVNDRSTETRNSYDVSANIDLGKLFPEDLRVQLPLYVGYSETFISPEFDPTKPDVKMQDALNALETKAQRDSLKALAQDYMERKSVNLTNMRVNTQHDKPRPWHLSNFTFNLAYYQTFRRNVTTEKALEKSYTGGIIYDFNTMPYNIEPFKSVSFLNKPAFKIIRDFNFNPKPTRFSIRTDMARSYNEMKMRNIENPNMQQNATVDKNWIWRRNFDLQWDLARSLKFDFSAGNQARIDEPIGIVDRHMKDEYELWRDSIWNNIKNGGRLTEYHHNFNVTYTIPINKLPLLEWTSATASYRGEYMWNVAPIYANDINFNPGNTINNRNTITLGTQFNFSTLYNKVPYFRNITQPTSNKQGEDAPKQYKTVTYTRSALTFRANEPRNITHALNTKIVDVKLSDANGNAVTADVVVLNENRVQITTTVDVTRATVLVNGSIEKTINDPLGFITTNTMRILLGVKNISIQYQENGGTTLPGYAMNSNMFGVSGSAPGMPFMLGWQDNNYAEKAAAKNWLVKEEQLNAAIAMTHTNSLNVRSTFEPFQNMRVNLSAIRSFTKNRSMYFIWDDNAGAYPDEYRSSQTSGNYSISIIAIRSSFEKQDPKKNYYSESFEKFKENRNILAARHAEELRIKNPSYNPVSDGNGGYDGINLEAQNVLISSFFATYADRDPQKVSLSDFPKWLYMMPNWDLNFDGLSNLPFIKKRFRSVGLRHTYKATYTVGSYISNFDYNADIAHVAYIARDLQYNFVPQNDIATVSITEAYGPLIGVDVKFLNSLDTRFDIKKGRNITLGLGNLQMTENNTFEYGIGVGYVFNQVSLIIRTGGGERKQLQSDLKVNADFTIRDNKTIIRRIGEIDDNSGLEDLLPVQASAGQNIKSIKITADYKISSNFTLTVFFDRVVNTPFVSTSYKNYNTNFGFTMRFMLVQ